MHPNSVNLTYLEKWLQSDENVYVGRPSNKISQKSCKWGNPYEVGQYGRKEAIRLYQQYLLGDQNLQESLPDLRGKILGCWCAPSKCHAEILHHRAGNHPIYQMAGTVNVRLSNLNSATTVDDIHHFLNGVEEGITIGTS